MTSSDEKIKELEKRIEALESAMPKDQVSIVLFSGELDRALAAFIIATGAAAMGMKVTMFFTFWGYGAIKKQTLYAGKDWMSKLLAAMSPSVPSQLPLSKMHFWGLGTLMMKEKMKEKNVSSLEDLIKMAQDLGITMISCEMTKDLMNIQDAELIDGLESGGVGAFLGEAIHGRLTLFI